MAAQLKRGVRWRFDQQQRHADEQAAKEKEAPGAQLARDEAEAERVRQHELQVALAQATANANAAAMSATAVAAAAAGPATGEKPGRVELGKVADQMASGAVKVLSLDEVKALYLVYRKHGR